MVRSEARLRFAWFSSMAFKAIAKATRLDLFFVTSAIADNICSKINSAIMMDERSYFEADIPY